MTDNNVIHAEDAEFEARLHAYDHTVGWFQVVSEDELEAFYRQQLPEIKQKARDVGWAVAVHGSLRRDLDLIALPWVDGACAKETLCSVIQRAACGITQTQYTWEQKTLGRWATTFPICWTEMNMLSSGHIDLSVVDTRE
jgi:hypothetical protein